jgi:putative transposase
MPWATSNLMNKRAEFATRAMSTENFRALCRESGISARVGYKWRDRFIAQGLSGMNDQSRRPSSCPRQLSEEEICRMVRIKQRHRHWGAQKIRQVYLRQHGQGPSESSFKRVLERCGLIEKRQVRAARQTGRIASGRKASAPNQVWTVDFKGWWHDREGRCEPLTVRDEYTRYVLELRALPDARTATVQACFERLFAEHGLPEAIRSDNGVPFASPNGLLGLSRLRVWWLAIGLDLERSRPGCPQDNGGHERLHRDIARELQGLHHEERQAAFEIWRREFNEERPHQALGMRVPAELYQPSLRKWKGTPEQISYPGMATRRVKTAGAICYEHRGIFISQALAGWDVGLRYHSEERMEVYFAQLLLGVREMPAAAFIPITKMQPLTQSMLPQQGKELQMLAAA